MSKLTLAPLPGAVNATSSSEESMYEKVKVTNGYGMLTKAGVTVQKGITAHLNVSMEVSALTVSEMKKEALANSSHLDTETRKRIEHETTSAGILGWFTGKKDREVRNQSNVEVRNESESSKKFFQSLKQRQASKVKVHGSLDAVGISFQPVEGHIFVEVSSIEFSDGTKTKVINTNSAIAAEGDGDTKSIKTGGNKLSVVGI